MLFIDFICILTILWFIFTASQIKLFTNEIKTNNTTPFGLLWQFTSPSRHSKTISI